MKSRIILSVVALLFLGAFAGLIVSMGRMHEDLVKTAILENAKLSSQAIAEFRTLYTKNVVQKVKDAGIEVTHDYHGKPNAIPLPATMSMELGKSMGQQLDGAETRLYSKKKEGGLRDAFQKKAWSNLNERPEIPFYEFTTLNGKFVLRYAVADRMRESCVNCHPSGRT